MTLAIAMLLALQAAPAPPKPEAAKPEECQTVEECREEIKMLTLTKQASTEQLQRMANMANGLRLLLQMPDEQYRSMLGKAVEVSKPIQDALAAYQKKQAKKK